MCVRYAETSRVPPPSEEEETQQSHLSGTFAVRTRCRVIRVDTVRRPARRSCQRCSCSHSHKLTIRSNMKRKENRAGQKTNYEVSHVQDGENSPTQTQRLLLLFCPNSSRLQCFLTRPCVSLPGGSSSSEARPVASLGSLLDDQHWHHLSLVLRHSQLNFSVDKHAEVVPVPAEFNIQQVGAAALL